MHGSWVFEDVAFLFLKSDGSVVFKSYDKSSGVSLRSSKVSEEGGGRKGGRERERGRVRGREVG